MLCHDLHFPVVLAFGCTSGDPQNCLSRADYALMQAIADPLKKYYEYTGTEKEMQSRTSQNLEWAGRVQTALRESRIVPFFQGIYDNNACRISKYECLVRMRDHDKIISPFQFLEAAEKSGQLKIITGALIRRTI